MKEQNSSLGVLDTTLCDKVCQWLAAGRWFSLGTQVSPTNKTDRHDITEILLKGALNTINYLPQQPSFIFIEQCLCIAFNIIWTTISQKSGPFITDSLREYTHTNFYFQINIFYKTFPALIYKPFLCYDVTITMGLLSRLHLQKQAVRLNITSDKKLWCIYIAKVL
jgi:hypothetical protein